MSSTDTRQEDFEAREFERATAEARTARRQAKEAAAAGERLREFDCKRAERIAQERADRMERSIARSAARQRGRSR